MINTKRLQIIRCEQRHLEALAASRATLAALLGFTLPPSWPLFPEAYVPSPAPEREANHPWGSYFFLAPTLKSLVGSGGFKGAPDNSGTVEIGYEIGQEHWNNGFASEAVRGLIDFAFDDPAVLAVSAHTLAEQNASCRVLQKAGLKFIREIEDPTDGKIWFWQMGREERLRNH